jgi:hypothetical protein
MARIVVDDETLEILHIYDGPANPWIHKGRQIPLLLVPEGLDPMVVMAIKDSETGEITLVQDAAKVAAKTAQAWQELRARRNALLATSDWTQLQDARLSLEKKQAWVDYRQALRDLPETVTDPMAVVWPLAP